MVVERDVAVVIGEQVVSCGPALPHALSHGVEEPLAHAEATGFGGDDEQLEGGRSLGRAGPLVVERKAGALHDARHLEVHGPCRQRVPVCLTLGGRSSSAPQLGVCHLAVLLRKQRNAQKRIVLLGNEGPGGVSEVVAQLDGRSQLARPSGEVGQPRLGDQVDDWVEISLFEGSQREFCDVF